MSKVEWICISPADLSTACCAQELKFIVKGEEIYHAAIDCDCMFTQAIRAAASLNRSIYEVEVWGAYGLDHKAIAKTRSRSNDEWKEMGQIA